VNFQYTSGSKALQLHEVALNDGASLVERDVHPGWTGIEAYDNRYYFRVGTVPADPSLTIIANGAGGTDSNGTITLSRCDVVDLGASWTPAACSTSRRAWRMDAAEWITGDGIHQLSLTRSGGSSAITIDRAWVEQNGKILGMTVADETLDASRASASWTLDLVGFVPGQPVSLFVISGSTTSAGSSGAITLSPFTGSGADPMSWQRWASGHGLDPEKPDLDSDHDGVADLIEFLQGTNPTSADALRPLELDAPDRLILRLAHDRTGAQIRMESSSDLQGWAEDNSLVFLSETAEAGDVLTRSYQIPQPVLSRFFRLRATRLP
jgi:hypothetical protein